MASTKLHLKDFQQQDLYSLSGLQKIDELFLKQTALSQEILESRQSCNKENSQLIISAAKELQEFIAQQFHIEEQCELIYSELSSHDPIIKFKNLFVQKLAKKRLKESHSMPEWSELENWRIQSVPQIKDQEWATAKFAIDLEDKDSIEKLVQWCTKTLAIKPELTKNWVSFSIPNRTDTNNLLDCIKNQNIITSKVKISRQGFDYTSKLMNSRQLKTEAHYCIICHPKDGDFCKIGFPVKKSQPEFKTNDLNKKLHGCPIEQHISEMNLLLQEGYPIAALAAAMINNPMIPATGYRICNDCMSSCIYQKQTAVDIPSIESKILDIVLNLPWGIEIYHLLTQWNPLRTKQWLPKPFNGHKVAIMGMGPAGFTAAHHLLMEGCAVVGLDGQAMTEMPSEWLEPIYNYQDIKSNLKDRRSIGFGGVAEYGITARWDKNLLSIIRLNLTRRKYFQCFSSVRFGGNWQLSDAWKQNFSHVVLAVGAGLPNIPNIPGSLANGMRVANDFLMTINLFEINKFKHLTETDVSLPAIVIGGGLTAVDTATELQAYYLILVEKVFNHFNEKYNQDTEAFKKANSVQDWPTISRWIEHGKELQAARKSAIKNSRKLDTIKLLHEWGGVTLAYRKEITKSPAYRENHLELQHAINEGIKILECANPIEIITNSNKVCGVKFTNEENKVYSIAAKSVWSAIGTKLNVAYSFEHRDEIEKANAFEYLGYTWDNKQIKTTDNCKQAEIAVFTSVNNNAGVSFIGDTNPLFHGSVVKAMASAKRSYPEIMKRINQFKSNSQNYDSFRNSIIYDFKNTLLGYEVDEDGAAWMEFQAPLIANKWQPGTFLRINFINSNKKLDRPITIIPISSNGSKITCYWQAADLSVINNKFQLMGPNGVRFNIENKDIERLWFIDKQSIGFSLALAQKINKNKLKTIIIDEINSSKTLRILGETIIGNEINENYIASTLMQTKIAELVCFTSLVMTKSVKEVINNKPLWLAEDAKIMAQNMKSMQCALKGICARCMHWQVDENGNRTKPVYTCSWQHQPLQLIEI